MTKNRKAVLAGLPAFDIFRGHAPLYVPLVLSPSYPLIARFPKRLSRLGDILPSNHHQRPKPMSPGPFQFLQNERQRLFPHSNDFLVRGMKNHFLKRRKLPRLPLPLIRQRPKFRFRQPTLRLLRAFRKGQPPQILRNREPPRLRLSTQPGRHFFIHFNRCHTKIVIDLSQSSQ
jgi:hypothetical protein